jgi:hypothetical protein
MQQSLSLMALLDEMKEKGIKMTSKKPQVHCTTFEDNSGAIAIANVPKARPRTKHINVKYHFFRQHVIGSQPKATVKKIDTKDQLADILTKGLAVELFVKFRKAIMGW